MEEIEAYTKSGADDTFVKKLYGDLTYLSKAAAIDTYAPFTHAASHAAGGKDPITPQSIGASGSMGVIKAGTNLNDLKAPGTYVQSSGSNATTALNYPAPSLAGYLVVSAPGHAAYLQQTYFPLRSASGAVWQRTMYGVNTFDAWVMVSPFRGTGSPEGVVTAPVGSDYIDTAGTNGAHRWYKSGGTGNTGWVVAEGDTGLRDVSDLLQNGVTAGVNGAEKPLLMRNNRMITLDLSLAIPSGFTSGATVLTLPAGFRPRRDIYMKPTYSAGSLVLIGASGIINLYDVPAGAVAWRSYYVFPVGSPAWPTTLPGTPA